ncbi:MAG: DUF1282 domain-containing protein [Pedobacter sp.]|nr:MAG: DUF1282 domain-containing protein [Pedobacter sp.]
MSLIDRVKNIIVTPKTEWEVIALKEEPAASVITGYVLPLAAIGAICAFVGYAFIGLNVVGIRMTGFNWGLYYAVMMFISAILGVLISAFFVDMLAPSFGSEKNMNKSVQLVAYSYTPSLIGAFLTIIPALSMIGGLFGIYGIYLWYLGLGPLKKTPEDKKVVYLIVSFILIFIVSMVIGAILGMILFSAMGIGAVSTGRFGM